MKTNSQSHSHDPAQSLQILMPWCMTERERQSLQKTIELANTHQVWTWQPFSKNQRVMQHLLDAGVSDDTQDLHSHSLIVIPPHGAPHALRKRWKAEGRKMVDFSTPEVRRAQTSLSLLKLEGAELIIIGSKDDPEVIAQITDHHRAIVVETAEDAVRIPFAPNYGVICETTFHQSLAKHLLEVMRNRRRDSRFTFLDTTDECEGKRYRQVADLTHDADLLLILGCSQSAKMLAHSAAEARIRAKILTNVSELRDTDLSERKIVVTAASDVLPEEANEMVDKIKQLLQRKNGPQAA